ncbi:histone-lysine N-methyltransferase, H3 lysine-9 specific SUVH6-like [Chenopodium quinoa]|uniref:histone-lysine N-methyltransferase, H3 lysine-9 specific SUVH6-like n=1 Tax=Chenopodium quinoa TaxID=63459 RepID=UPI000B798185|nr:histone-lysine N-methyltransferase, H3 lysine-9 specific SUVH6-like [Chenopodium quinoa]
MEIVNYGSKHSNNHNSRVTFSRDFPPGCGCVNANSPFMILSDKKSVHHYARDFPLGCCPNGPKITQFGGDLSDWRRVVGAVRSKQVMGDKEVSRNVQNLMGKGKKPVLSSFSEVKSKEREKGVDLKKPVLSSFSEGRSKEREKGVDLKKAEKVKGKGIVMNNSGGSEREKVVGMLSLFRKRCKDISMSGRGVKRVDITAYNELKNEGKIVNRSAVMIGNVPCVDVGDKFQYRIELLIVGLHKQTQGGIDSMEWRGGRISTSIVANERHLDKMNDPNALTYIGEGGVLKRHEVGVPPDQELKGGNRALWTSWKEKRPVRVIRGLVSEKSNSQKLYVYDGLYEVGKWEKKKGPQGNMIFEFQLARCDGQPAVPWQECRRSLF